MYIYIFGVYIYIILDIYYLEKVFSLRLKIYAGKINLMLILWDLKEYGC